jgi:signal transduction histidine kinase
MLAVVLGVVIPIFLLVDASLLIGVPGYVPPWYGYLFLGFAWWLNRMGALHTAACLLVFMFPVVALSHVALGQSANVQMTLSFLAVSPMVAAIFLPLRGVAVLSGVNLSGILALPLVGAGPLRDVTVIASSFGVNALGAALSIAFVAFRDRVEADRRAELKAQEELLRHGQRLEAMGQLAGGVAHDFNNLLTVISGNVELLRAERPSPELDDIAEAARSGAELARQLLTTARRGPVASEELDLVALVRETGSMTARLIGSTVRHELELPDRAVPVVADRQQLQHVLLNLAANARDAMPEGGVLRLAVGSQDLDAEAAHPLGLEPGRYGKVEVTDTGVGMSAETLARALEPFFTTKPAGKGTGLGLASAFGSARQAGGTLHLASVLGSGTTVTLWLPLHQPAAPAPA